MSVDHGAPISIAFATDDLNLSVPVDSAVTFAVTAQDKYGNEWTLDPSQYGVIAVGDTDSINSNTLRFDNSGQFTVTAIVNGTLVLASTQITVTDVAATGPVGTCGTRAAPARTDDRRMSETVPRGWRHSTTAAISRRCAPAI
ncbi:MAG: hypothetical protein ACLP8S_15065 [Solirubrobacteraceae bacterium]